jgi:dsRNA-specific ribonuclease
MEHSHSPAAPPSEYGADSSIGDSLTPSPTPDCSPTVDDGQDILHNPYNPLNIEICAEDVRTILKTYGVPPNCLDNMELYKRAFIHKSYVKKPDHENIKQNIRLAPCPDGCMKLHTKSNDRIEFLGDGVLELIVKYYLYRRFPKENEGFMTDKKIAIVKNETIGKIAHEMGLHKWIVISKNAEEKNVRTDYKKLGCLFEAFVGALFLDVNKMVVSDSNNYFDKLFVTGPGFQMTQIFVENVIERHIDLTALIQSNDNYKNILQEIIQREFSTTPDYLQTNIEANGPTDGYVMSVYLCLGQPIYAVSQNDAVELSEFSSFDEIRDRHAREGKLFVRLGTGNVRKQKKKSAQVACEEAINSLKTFGG